MNKNILICAIALMASSSIQAGEIHWRTNQGTESRTDCAISAHSHNDDSQISEYWVDCANNAVTPIQIGPVTGNSSIYFDSQFTLVCKMDASIFGQNDDFYMSLDCRKKPAFVKYKP